jgi:hypothetical protein
MPYPPLETAILTGNDLGKLGNINQYLRLMRSSLSRKRKILQLSSIKEKHSMAKELIAKTQS